MGGGDLNMKKSWHPLLLKNQERVWLEEKKALEEKKKLDTLRKEKEEERQLQELQRLQEQQTGKKRTEKLEWMYSTPATGSSQNANDLEDYLLGKKRVDKILTGDDNAKIGASHKNFIAVQNANTVRDVAAKIREDPLLAIKQQEQAAYEALMANPLRLREMQRRNGIAPKKDKSERKREKEERRRLKQERKEQKHRRDYDSRSPSPLYDQRSPSEHRYSHRRRSSSPRRRSASPSQHSRYDEERRSRYEDEGSRLFDNHRRHSSASPRESYRGRRDHRSGSPDRCSKRSRSRTLDRFDEYDRRVDAKRPRTSPPPRTILTTASRAEQDRAARLASMTQDASTMSAERQQRLTVLLEKEKAELAAEDARRAKSKGYAGFLSQEQKKVFGASGGLEDRIRRGRGGMVGNID